MADAASRLRLAGVLLAAGLMLVAACGDDDEGGASDRASAPPAVETAPDGSITVQLVEENDSGASGTATLTDGDDGASVTLDVSGGGRYHAHIHDVSCQRYRRMDDFTSQLATVSEGLTDLTAGRSKSDLIEPLSSYTRPGFSINVHEFAEPYPVVACGDLSTR